MPLPRLSLSASPLYFVPQETLEAVKWETCYKTRGKVGKVLKCYSVIMSYIL